MPVNHSSLVELSHNVFGYPLHANGLCYGLSLSIAKALCHGRLEHFSARFDVLETLPQDKKEFDLLLKRVRHLKKTGQVLDEHEVHLLELQAFFEQVHLFQSETPDEALYHEPTPPQSIRSILNLHNESIDPETPLFHINTQSGVFTEYTLKQCLDSLAPYMNPQVSIIVSLNSLHSVCLSYDSDKKRWYLFDTYNLPEGLIQEVSSSEIYNQLFKLRPSQNVSRPALRLPYRLESFQQCLTFKLVSSHPSVAMANDFALCIQTTRIKRTFEPVSLEAWQKTVWLNDDQDGLMAVLQLPIPEKDKNLLLYVSCMRGNLSAVEACLKAGASLNVEVYQTHTPFMVACLSPYTRKNRALFKQLEQLPLNIGHRNADGKTALDLAVQSGNIMAINSIRKYCRRHNIPAATTASKDTLEKLRQNTYHFFLETHPSRRFSVAKPRLK